ncbi:CDP-glycerol glycerophosphotransferase family protein [[Clostridium] polysaccharolyticum]|jgi:CDP-glycerol glycerophosphotransferase|uniref:CDP-glycerol glycerophosphotransferase n=1 Tax=[Clostridium] polysaccharolyticum TaxID=29364 RepID=A0A1H9ZD71_9FIRM|nr:CDP-glycerol glycerophosphotransferase family protein [[Clostridium] polysaccharolyticum]SES79581.1 CDP-glycerol glycerophosphotransferase [[Clostridium] polysaccharolyticum]
MKKIIKKSGKYVFLLLYACMRKVLPVKKNVIFFESNVGRNYTGNPKAIYEKFVELGLDRKYDCVYSLENTEISIPGKIKKIKRLRFFYFYYLAIAGIWVSDSRLPEFVVKRKGTSYIQTWHGTPLKKLALDMDSIHMDGESSLEEYKKKFQENSSTWDYLISQNSFSSEVFERCFDFHKKMLEYGYPRNDVLFARNSKDSIIEIKKNYGIPEGKKVILYAPTWRDNEFYGDNRYKFNQALDYHKLMEQLSEDYVLLVKCHYLVQDTIDWSEFEGFVYSFDSKTDIADLYLVSDYLITDYSSVMFDYSILKRPMFFFAYDLEAYKDELRGFYFDYLEEIPGPVSQNTEELAEQILSYNKEQWTEKYEAFSKKFNTFDDGNAAANIAKLIESL